MLPCKGTHQNRTQQFIGVWGFLVQHKQNIFRGGGRGSPQGGTVEGGINKGLTAFNCRKADKQGSTQGLPERDSAPKGQL